MRLTSRMKKNPLPEFFSSISIQKRKSEKHLDGVNRNSKTYHNFTLKQIEEYVKLEMECAYVKIGKNIIMKQNHGIPIGD